MGLEIIDPNDINFSTVPEYENAFIFADLTATRRGNTNLGTANQEAVTISFLGYDQRNGREGDFSSRYSYLNLSETADNVHEGFGITNIKIETNSSYVPKITVEMVDIRGATLFNKGASSPYSIIMDFPPPLFELTVKGYYGKPLGYKLHLLRQNSSVDSTTGNVTITAEFIASTYGILADIPIGYLLALPFMDSNYDISTLENSTFPVNTFELIYKFKSLFQKIDGIKNDKDIVEADAKATTDLENVDSYYEMMNGISDSKFYGKGKTNAETVWVKSDSVIKNNILYAKKSGEINLIKEKIKEDIETNGDKSLFKDFDTSTITIKHNKTDDVLETPVPETPVPETPVPETPVPETPVPETPVPAVETTNIPKTIEVFNNILKDNPLIKGVIGLKDLAIGSLTAKSFTIDFTTLVAVLASSQTIIEDSKTDTENKIAGEAEKASVELFGNQKPTVGKIFEIICNDIDGFMTKINSVGREADTHHETNKAEIVKVASGYVNMGLHNNSKIYPFPTITSTENNSGSGSAPRVRSKGYIGQLFKDFNPQFPEYKFVEDFVQATLDKAKKEESFDKQDGVNEKTGDTFWLPLSPMAVGFDGKTSKCPYVGKTTPQELINVYMARVVALLSHIFNVNAKSSGLETIISSVLKIEAENMFTYITKEEIFSALADEKQLETYILSGKTAIGAGYKTIDIVKYGSEKELYELDIYNNVNLVGAPDEVSDTIDDTIKNPFKSSDFDKKDDLTEKLSVVKGITEFFDEKIPFILNSRGVFYLPDEPETKTLDGGLINSIYFNPKAPLIDEKDFYNTILREMLFEKEKVLFGVFPLVVSIVTPNDREGIIKTCRKLVSDFELKTIQTLQTASILEIPKIILVIIGGAIQKLIDEPEPQNLIRKLRNKTTEELNINSNVKSVTTKIFDDFVNIDLVAFRNAKELYKTEFIKPRYYYNAIEYEDDVAKQQIATFRDDLLKSDLYKEYFVNKVYYKINYASLYSKKRDNIYYNIFAKNIDKDIIAIIKDRKKTIEKKVVEETAKIERKFENADVKQKLYQSFKSLYERWCVSRNIDAGFEDFGGKLFNTFKFVDRGYNDIANECYISVKPLLNFEDTPDSSMFSVIASLLSYNSFEFFPLQNFLEFNTDAWKQVFSIHSSQGELDKVVARPQFTCMYMGGTSSVLENDLGRYKNDGFSLEDTPMEDFASGNVRAFMVSFAKQNQSIFKNIQLSTTEHRETNESLKILATIAKDDSNTSPEPVGQNLFPIHEQRSYSCTVEMMGNVMIQPVQYFELKNVPMYSGAYMILDVTHTIVPNSMTTSFKGIRVAKFPNPLVTNFLASNGVSGSGGSYDNFFEGLGGETIIHPLGSGYTKGAALHNIGMTSTFIDESRTPTLHGGIDLVAEKGAGSPVFAVADGKVAQIWLTSTSGGYGNGIILHHSSGYITRYGHFSQPPILKVGDNVKQGEQIGLEGSTGKSTAPHLHFELSKGAKLLDPAPYLKGLSTLNGISSEKSDRSSFNGGSDILRYLPGLKKFTGKEHDKVVKIAKKFNIDPNWLYVIMNSESGLNSKQKNLVNPDDAVGLIQFTPITATEFKTTMKALHDMTAYEQLDYVEKFYDYWKGPYKSLESLYLVTFYPVALAHQTDLNWVVGSQVSKAEVVSVASHNATFKRKKTDDFVTIGSFYEFVRRRVTTEGYAVFGNKTTSTVPAKGIATILKKGINTVDIGGVSVDIYVPDKPAIGDIIALHGWGPGQDKTFWDKKTSLVKKALKNGYRVILPECGLTGYASQDYPDTSTTQRDALKLGWFTNTLLNELKNTYNIFKATDNTFVIGLSTGARGGALMNISKPTAFDGCALLSGDYDQYVSADSFMTQIYGAKQKNPTVWKEKDNVIFSIRNSVSWRTPTYIGCGANDVQGTNYLQHAKLLHAKILKVSNLKDKDTLILNVASGQGHNATYWDSEVDNVLKFFNKIISGSAE